MEAKAQFRRRWFLRHSHQKGKRKHDVLDGKSCFKCCWQTNYFFMLNSLKLEEREIFHVKKWSWGKKGIQTEGKSVFLSSFPPQRTGGLMSFEKGIHGFMVEDHVLEQLPWNFSWFTFIWLPVQRVPNVNWNQNTSESYFSTKSWLSHILPYLTLHKWSRENSVMWLLYGNLNEKDGCWHAFLNMWYSKSCCRTKEAQTLIWDNDGQEVAGVAEKIWVL